jgi:glyceraldehyde 3-phosphate dehydrogenase
MAVRVAINGFGRIGRQVFKIIHNRFRDRLQVVCFGVTNPHNTDVRALLLKFDSNYGIFDAEVTANMEGGHNDLVVDGQAIRILGRNPYGPVPEWNRADVDLVIEASGHYSGRSHLHLTAGARRVIVTAPDRRADLTVVMGINHTEYDTQHHKVVSNASCTTNCLAPIAKVLHDKLGIKTGLMTTIHAYTGSQPVLDHAGSDPRRSRSAATNIVPTSTGAARAVAEVIPDLEGRLNGCAYRVPIPTVSIAELCCHAERPADAAEVNAAFRQASDEGMLKGILGYSELPLVSSDFRGTTHSSVLDARSTMCSGELVKVAAWYDNEWGYACRVAELAAFITEQGL